MKKLLPIILLTFVVSFVNAQGLENVIVEKYYISDGNDTTANADGGDLPVGSVTYRIYADLLQGHKLQGVYGVAGHPMRIETSTLFFNNEFLGSTSPNSIPKTLAGFNTVMLDSWLSVGAACTGNYGVLKSLDNGTATVVNASSPQVLQNNDPAAGIPLTQEDGLITGQAGAPQQVTFVGLSTEVAVFDNQNDGTNGPLFYSDNGTWAALNGAVGPDTVDNKVLIAQITTDGTFEFELNIQIGLPNGLTENYVASNPVGAEIQASFLTYASNVGVLELAASKSEPDFTIYPNPAHDFLNLVTDLPNDGTGFYSIYSADGRVISHNRFGAGNGNTTSVDVSALSAGQYILGIYKDGRSSARPFIKY
jgi:hypothetical protein